VLAALVVPEVAMFPAVAQVAQREPTVPTSPLQLSMPRLALAAVAVAIRPVLPATAPTVECSSLTDKAPAMERVAAVLRACLAVVVLAAAELRLRPEAHPRRAMVAVAVAAARISRVVLVALVLS
jgi:hypothetical protein